MNFIARFIDLVWALTQRACHWQLIPMLSATGSVKGARASAGTVLRESVINAAKTSHRIDLSMPFLIAHGNRGYSILVESG
jgi:hypothetical protein